MFLRLCAGVAALATVYACNPLKPRSLEQRETSQVSVAFEPSNLGELANQMKTLQIRVFKVENDVTGAQEGADNQLAIELQKKEYTLTGIKLGHKEFEVSILDANNTALGVGKVRHVVKPGPNVTAPLIIKLTPVAQPNVSVGVELDIKTVGEATVDGLVKKVALQWKNAAGTQTGEIVLATGAVPTTYDDLKQSLEDNCTGCHADGFAQKKLYLDQWPFKSLLIADNAALMNKFMARLQDEDKPMPPDGLLPTAEIARYKAWQAGGFVASVPANAGSLFRGQIDGVKVSDKITCTLVVTGVDGVELLKKEIDPYVVQLSGALKLSVELNPAAPSVAIPIIVEQ